MSQKNVGIPTHYAYVCKKTLIKILENIYVGKGTTSWKHKSISTWKFSIEKVRVTCFCAVDNISILKLM